MRGLFDAGISMSGQTVAFIRLRLSVIESVREKTFPALGR